MAVGLMGQVFDSNLGASRKLVALAYADCADAIRSCAWASVAYLEQRTSLDRKTIIAAVTALETAGILTDTGERVGRTKQIKVYFVTVPFAVLIEESYSWKQRNPETPSKSPVFPLEASRKRDTEPSFNRPEPSRNRPRRAAPPSFTLPDWIPAAAWDGFVEMRQKIRKPATARACALIVAELDKLRAEGHDPGPVLNQSTRNDWQDVYPIKLKTNGNGNGHHGGNGSAPAPIADGKIACRKCGNRVGSHTDRLCDPCYRTR